MLRSAFVVCLSLAVVAAPLGGCCDQGYRSEAKLKAARQSQAYMDGRAEALADIERNHLELRTSGLTAGYIDVYARLLKDRLGVHHNLTGCVVTADSNARDGAYNAVMTGEIERRHGPGVLDTLRGEAKAKWAAAATRPAI